MKYVPLNFGLMRNPYNWIIVTLIVASASLALAALFPQSQDAKQ